jgi:predicted transcriptional regulator
MATLREIAEECGTTKQTVTSRLKEMGLWDGHVSKSGRTFEVDGFAASAVADSLKTAHKASESPTTVVDGKIAADVLNTAIDGLKTALSASQEQNAALARELDAKNSQIASLQEQVASQQRTIDRLSSRSWFDRVFGRGLPPASTE